MAMTPFYGEILGTALLILFGGGVCANVSLARSKARNAGWMVVVTGWAMGVFIGAFTAGRVSGGHLNPAVTLAFALTGRLAWAEVPTYVAGQVIGAMIGAALVWLAFLPHWAETDDQATKLGVFSTIPAIRRPLANLLCEIIGTFALMVGVFGIKDASLEPAAAGSVVSQAAAVAVPVLKMGALGALPVALLVWGIGLALGGPTGYAINPARDLGPRIAHALLPIAGKGPSDWSYAWVPIVGPLVGATLAAWLYMALGQF